MSVQKSTIDRFASPPRPAPDKDVPPTSANTAASTPALGSPTNSPTNSATDSATAPATDTVTDSVTDFVTDTASVADPATTVPAPAPASVSGVPGSAALRNLFAQLERWSPALGGLLAERLWFRLPGPPSAQAREARTPAGGEPFEVAWAHGTLRGRAYGDWGNPTAYLLHGWGGWWQQLAAHVEPLVQRGLCVVALDAPSHGDSAPGAHGRRSSTFPEMAEALAAVVGEFGRPTLVVAHSAGALAAVHALGLGVCPDSLVLIAPPAGVEEMLPVFSAALGLGPRSQQVLARRAERRVGTAVAELDLLAMAARHPSLPHLLVVHDRDDREAPFASGVGITTAWHGARLLATEGLGHRRVLWDPAVVERVTAFAAAAADRVRRSSR